MVVGKFRDVRVDEAFMWDRLINLDEYLSEAEESLAEFVTREGVIDQLLSIAEDMFSAVVLSYSLGEPVERIRLYLDGAVDYFVRYMREEEAYFGGEGVGERRWSWQDSPALVIFVAQLLSLVVLWGDEGQRVRIGEVLGFAGSETVLEFLAGMHGDSLVGVDVVLSHDRPYGRLVKVLQAEGERREKLMAGFVKYWYNGCRKAPWWGEHLEVLKYGGGAYWGYWCFECAAVTKLLGLDDGLYRGSEFYPGDALVEGGVASGGVGEFGVFEGLDLGQVRDAGGLTRVEALGMSEREQFELMGEYYGLMLPVMTGLQEHIYGGQWRWEGGLVGGPETNGGGWFPLPGAHFEDAYFLRLVRSLDGAEGFGVRAEQWVEYADARGWEVTVFPGLRQRYTVVIKTDMGGIFSFESRGYEGWGAYSLMFEFGRFWADEASLHINVQERLPGKPVEERGVMGDDGVIYVPPVRWRETVPGVYFEFPRWDGPIRELNHNMFD